MTAGIDLSNNNPNFAEWDGVEFAFLKASESTNFTDRLFVGFRAECSARGIPWGAYHFAHPEIHSAADEAAYFLSRPGVHPSPLPCALDFETRGAINPVSVMGPSAAGEWIDEWCTIVRDATGPDPYLYTFRDYAKRVLPFVSGQWPLWLASASGSPGAYTSYAGRTVAIEQWGIEGGISRNEMYVTPFAPIQPPPVPHPTQAKELEMVILQTPTNGDVLFADGKLVGLGSQWSPTVPREDLASTDAKRGDWERLLKAFGPVVG